MKRTILLLALLAFPFALQAKNDLDLHIIPCPQSIEMQKGTFKVKNAVVNCDAALDLQSQDVARKFANQLSLVIGKVSSFTVPVGIAKAAEAGTIKGFVFVRNSSLSSGEYVIEVMDKAVKISTSDFYGTLYAIQTLKQMLPRAIYGHKQMPDESWSLPCVTIKDKPRFGYRGMHLDCARHFFSIDEVKRYLDVMAVYKLNRLHWHLTDDQGWRVEIKAYPNLTQKGAYRNGTCIGKDFSSNDGIRYGGYYTQNQIREVIAYAESLGITIVPEIDLPGHMVAALAAYPELGCTGGPYEVWTRWGISDSVLCPGKPEVFTFLEGVLGEIADLFPGEYVHIGGDECPKTEWKKCPDCQALIAQLGLKDDDNATAEQYLQNYVMERMMKFLSTKGKKAIGWDEILEGTLAEGTTVMSWRGASGGIKAAGMGYDVIMTPNSHFYLDYYQSDDKDAEPLAIGGFLPIEKCYSFDPFEGIEPAMQKHILGVQANLWTEYIATPEYLEYMLLPRMCALSEVQWCAPEVRDFDRFKTSLIDYHFPILDSLGYTYSKVIAGVNGMTQ